VEAVLLIETEGESPAEAASLGERVALLCRLHRASDTVLAATTEEAHRLWALRHAASPTLAQLAPRLRSMQFIEDGCVPPDGFADYVRGVRSALARFDTPGVIFGHAGDAHAHVNPLIDTARRDWRDRVRGILDEVCELVARLGGTLAGEHGDGRLRAPLLDRVWSAESRAAFMNLKDAADPAGVLNSGCKIAEPADDPLASIRYDPALSPLDPGVRDVLDGIERDRAWHRFRLEGAEKLRS
jgi:FAD/FMN-containing dehydrogenase